MPTAARYTQTAIALHWLIFALAACGFALAVYMVDLPLAPPKLKYYSWHKWLGVTVFLLALARLAWRLTHPAPALPDPGHPLAARPVTRAPHHLAKPG